MFLLTVFLLFPTFLCEYSSKESLIASNRALLEALKLLTESETQVGGGCEGLADKPDETFTCSGDNLDCDNAYQRKIKCKKTCCEAATPEAPKAECSTPPNPKCELCRDIDDCGGKNYKVTTYEATGSSLFGTCTYPKNVETVSECPPEFVSAPNMFVDQGSGKCQTIKGADPKHKYHPNKGLSSCRSECDESPDCFGLSVSSYGNCLHWLQQDIQGGGNEWGSAKCFVKQKTPGFDGMDYCYNEGTIFKGEDPVVCCTGESKKEDDGLCTEMSWDQMMATIDDDKKKAFSALDLSDVVQTGNCQGRQGKEANCITAAKALGLGFYEKFDKETGDKKPTRLSTWPTGCVFSQKKKMLLYNSRITRKNPSKAKTQICFFED